MLQDPTQPARLLQVFNQQTYEIILSEFIINFYKLYISIRFLSSVTIFTSVIPIS
jgi:hypothetical protein